MPALQASRRLVKSPPELWAEVSDAASLARHLGELGEIRITRLEADTIVAWEGERTSGTVELAPAGWGTAVTLTAEPIAAAVEPAAEPVAAPAPEPAAAAEPEPAAAAEPRRFRLASLFRRRAKAPAPAEPPAAVEPPAAAPPRAQEPPAADPLLDALTAALDSLGAAHHRPFSRG